MSESSKPYKVKLTDSQFIVISHNLPKGFFLKRQKGRTKQETYLEDIQQNCSDQEEIDEKESSQVNPILKHSCGQQKMAKDELQTCNQILAQIKRKKFSQQFRLPVDAIGLGIPHYYQIIKFPMDLKTMSQKIERNQYIAFGQFYEDLKRISKNCQKFNYDSPYYLKKAQIFLTQSKKVISKYYNLESEEEDNSNSVNQSIKKQTQIQNCQNQRIFLKDKKDLKIKRKQQKKKSLKYDQAVNSSSLDQQQQKLNQKRTKNTYDHSQEQIETQNSQQLSQNLPISSQKEQDQKKEKFQKEQQQDEINHLQYYQKNKCSSEQVNSAQKCLKLTNNECIQQQQAQIKKGQNKKRKLKKLKKGANRKKPAALYGQKQTQKILKPKCKAYTYQQKIKLIERVKKLSIKGKTALFNNINFKKGQTLDFRTLKDEKVYQIQTQLCITQKGFEISQGEQRKTLENPENQNNQKDTKK